MFSDCPYKRLIHTQTQLPTTPCIRVRDHCEKLVTWASKGEARWAHTYRDGHTDKLTGRRKDKHGK